MVEINWLPEKLIKINFNTSLSRYRVIERDFEECLEYVQLHEENIKVFSIKFADLILRTGPEILRLFHLFVFNHRRTDSFEGENILEKRIIGLQEKCRLNKETFYNYFEILNNDDRGSITKYAIEIKPLNKFIIPFKTEKRIGKKNQNLTIIPWWQEGYNALKHRIIDDFNESATYKNVLFSLAGYRILYEEFLSRDLGTFFTLPKTQVFGKILQQSEIEAANFAYLDYRV